MNTARASATGVLFALTLLISWQHAYSQLATPADEVVAQLRELPTPLPRWGTGPHALGQRPQAPESEIRRQALYDQLHAMGAEGVTALARGYRDRDVSLRRNVALAFIVLGGGYGERPALDITAALGALTRALSDPDADVRAWSAQAIGYMGAEGAAAVPTLVRLLRNRAESSRNSACLALRGIGKPAASALPALRRALSDPRADTREFARLAIEAIERDE
jgi:HEAT repeat protein